MKNALLSFVFVVVASAAFAQVSGGIRLGMNLANQKIKTDGVIVTGVSKVGFIGGLYLVANLSEKFGIQPELLFSGMGTTSADDSDIKNQFNYLSVPLMLRYNVTENVNFQAGPQLGFLMSAKITDGGNSVDFKEFFKGTDFGATFGAGVDFSKFNAGIRYYLGLSNIAEDAGSDEFFKNNGVQIFVGYRLFGGE